MCCIPELFWFGKNGTITAHQQFAGDTKSKGSLHYGTAVQLQWDNTTLNMPSRVGLMETISFQKKNMKYATEQKNSGTIKIQGQTGFFNEKWSY